MVQCGEVDLYRRRQRDSRLTFGVCSEDRVTSTFIGRIRYPLHRTVTFHVPEAAPPIVVPRSCRPHLIGRNRLALCRLASRISASPTTCPGYCGLRAVVRFQSRCRAIVRAYPISRRCRALGLAIVFCQAANGGPRRDTSNTWPTRSLSLCTRSCDTMDGRGRYLHARGR